LAEKSVHLFVKHRVNSFVADKQTNGQTNERRRRKHYVSGQSRLTQAYFKT